VPTALITGASTGLGREFAALFAADGDDVVLVSSPRSADALEALAGELRTRHAIRADAISVDLAAADAARDLDARVNELGVEIAHLVNNAGFGIAGLKLQDCDPEAVSRVVRLNVQTLTDLTMLALPRMVARGHGSILNVSSLAAYVVPHGLEAVYAASKAYVMSFSESVAQDLRGTGVSCTHLAPGPTRTEFFNTAGLEDDGRMDGFAMDAASVARAGYQAMREGRAAVMPGWANRVLRTAAVLSPSRRLTAAASGYFVTRHQ
jgi:short-subunit dehydrogenase